MECSYSQDHKRIGEGDTGPNTGGMGAYAPTPIITDQMMQYVKDKILLPAISGLRREGRPYTGVLYAGILLVFVSDNSFQD